MTLEPAVPAGPGELPHVDAVVLAAMDEEALPLAGRADHISPAADAGRSQMWSVVLGGASVLLVRTGIGLVSAASGLVAALARCRPAAVLATGSAGGLGRDVQVGDVVVGQRYTYAGADATAFGYVLGQVPGMPADYAADERLLAAARGAGPVAGTLRVGTMVSGDSFVTATTVDRVRADFPGALSADMESTALAQVCHSYRLPFLSVRGISDLCGPSAGQDFRLGVDEAAARAATVVLTVLAR